jgi:hypothetical protein
MDQIYKLLKSWWLEGEKEGGAEAPGNEQPNRRVAG